MKPTEYKIVCVRRGGPKEAAELLISAGSGDDAQVIRLRPAQLDGLIRDAVAARFMGGQQ